MDPGRLGQRLHAAEKVGQSVVVDEVPDGEHALQRPDEDVDLARLGEVLVRGPDGRDDRPPVAVLGEDHAGRPRVATAHLGEQLRAVHPGHPQVGDDGVERPLGHAVQRLRAAGGELQLPPGRRQAQRAAQSREEVRVVVDEQHPADGGHDDAAPALPPLAPTFPGPPAPARTGSPWSTPRKVAAIPVAS